MEKIIIAAIDEENGIGRENKLPWHYPEDLKHFKQQTTGHTVLMGRKTYQSLPENYRPLPNRENIVLTRSNPKLHERVKKANSLAEAWKKASKDKIFIAGGETVYRQALPEAGKMILTRIPGLHDCDSFFPEWDAEKWRLESSKENSGLVFEEYTRKDLNTEKTKF